LAETRGILIEALFWPKVAAATLLAVLLGRWMFRTYRAARRQRLHALDALLPALDQAEVALTPARFPVARGRLDGSPIRVELVPDTLVLRALPVLWLEARWRRRHQGRLRLVLRPTGTEYFTANNVCRRRLPPPPGWAEPVEIWGEGGDAGEILRRLGALNLADFPSLKQVVITEQELRVTLRCKQGERAAYRVLRAAYFDEEPLEAAQVAQLLGALRTIERAMSPQGALK